MVRTCSKNGRIYIIIMIYLYLFTLKIPLIGGNQFTFAKKYG